MRKLKKNPELAETYTQIIAQQEAEGIIERVHEEGEVGNTFYLPHHPVIRQDKSSTKVRVVYDGSSRENGVSLNDCLQGGQSRFTDLFSVLLRFRTHKFCVSADLEKAFLQVGIQEDDRDLLRFLFYEDIHAESPKLITFKFKRVCFGINSSMALLGSAIDAHFEKNREQNPSLIKSLEDGLYVDDVVTGAETKEEILKIHDEGRELFRKAGMNLRKWRTNLKEVRSDFEEENLAPPDEKFAAEDRGYAQTVLENPHSCSQEKILGIPWNSDTDELCLSLTEIGHRGLALPKTKRNILSLSASEFDPFGFMCPVIIVLKILFQKICESKGGWDDEVEEPIRKRWVERCESAILMPA